MKITKLVHSCLLVETSDRVTLFDPGVYSDEAIKETNLTKLNDILITHRHADHLDVRLIQSLRNKFPSVNITAPTDALEQLEQAGITDVSSLPSDGVEFFDSPHEAIRPFIDAEPPGEIGYHYLRTLSHPGDSHSFSETMPILALPVQAPWGSVVDAVRLALELKPKYIIPIHDWHWNDAAREGMYSLIEDAVAKQDIIFLKPHVGTPIEINIA